MSNERPTRRELRNLLALHGCADFKLRKHRGSASTGSIVWTLYSPSSKPLLTAGPLMDLYAWDREIQARKWHSQGLKVKKVNC